MLSLTLLSLIGYATLGIFVIGALAHRMAATELCRRISRGTDALHVIVGVQAAGGMRHDPIRLKSKLRALESPRHPGASVLERVIQDPEMASDELALEAWIEQALHRWAGGLLARMEETRTKATLLGLIFTIVGMVCTSVAFAEHHDPAVMLGSIALAMVTTGMGAFVSVLEVGAISPVKLAYGEAQLKCVELATVVRKALSEVPEKLPAPLLPDPKTEVQAILARRDRERRMTSQAQVAVRSSPTPWPDPTSAPTAPVGAASAQANDAQRKPAANDKEDARAIPTRLSASL